MNNEYSKYCKNVFTSELKKEKLNNVKLKVIPLIFSNTSGYIRPNIEKSSYELIINSSNYSEMSEENKMFYTYVTICHEIEHIKTFEKTKNKDFYDFEHFVSLLEYISFLEENNVSYDNINLGIKSRQLIMKSLKRNYNISTNELKCSLIGYEKAKEANVSKPSKNINIIIESLRFLNQNMELCYNKNEVPVDKFALYLSKTCNYVKKYPKILEDYKILLNFFDTKGRLKEIYEVYSSIDDKNKKFYDEYIIKLLSVIKPNEAFSQSLNDNVYKKYIEELIDEYNKKVMYYYQNIQLGTIFIENEKYLYENLKILLERIKRLNKISNDFNLNKRTGIIL